MEATTGAGDELAALLPSVLEPWAANPSARSHADPVILTAAANTNAIATTISMAITRHRPTRSPMATLPGARLRRLPK
jgi:hypothetical protein